MAIEAEAFEHQGVELTGEKIGEIERAGRCLRKGGEALLTGEARIAMRPGEPFYRFLLEHGIESTAGAAIGIGDIDVVMRGPGVADGVSNGAGDQRRAIVQRRRQAAQIQVRQAVRLDDGNDLAGQGATGDDQRALHGPQLLAGRHGDGARSMSADRRGSGRRQAITRCWLCLRAMKRCAVSTATEASRQ